MEQGDKVEDFELPDQHGQPRRLAALLEDGPVVLFFYPAAMTKGCTAEVCHFRDLASEFRAAGAQPVGISADAVDRQQEFSSANDVGFPLLSDPDRAVAERFGVRRKLLPVPVKRQTFVIDTDFRIVDIIRNEFDMNAHADRALEALRRSS